MAEVEVVVSALRSEAKKWKRLADDSDSGMVHIRSLIESETSLTEGAFLIDVFLTGGQHYHAYEKFWHSTLGLTTQASTEFEQMGRALDRAADIYDDANNVIEFDLNKMYQE